MSEVKGKMITCERCGRQIFLKFIEKRTTDGGFGDTYEVYEEKPDSWMWNSQIGNLCPHCSGLFRVFIHKLMFGKHVAPAWSIQEEDNELMNCVTINDCIALSNEVLEDE